MAVQKGSRLKVSAGKSTPKSASKKRNVTPLYRPKPSENLKGLESGVKNEITFIIMILFSVVALFSLFSNKMGMIGSLFNSLLKGFLGVSSFLLPVTIIAFCVWLLAGGNKQQLKIRVISAGLFLIGLSALFYSFHPVQSASNISFFQKCTSFYHNGSFSNGGILGGIFGSILIKAFDKMGTIFVIFVFLLICVIMGTGKSFLSTIETVFDYQKAKKKQKEETSYYEEEIKINTNWKEKKPKKPFTEKEALEKKKPKNTFNITIDEELYEKERNAPVIQAMEFKKNPSKKRIEESKVYDLEAIRKQSAFSQPEGVVVLPEEVPEETRIFEPIIHTSGGFSEEEEIERPLIDEEEIKAEVKAALVGNVTAEPVERIPHRRKRQVSDEPKIVMKSAYEFPSMDILGQNELMQGQESKSEMLQNAKKLEDTLRSFGVEARVIQINKGPTVTRYEVSPSQGVKVSKIVNLSDDIALNLAASGIRIEAPIPGKAAVGIEVPNKLPQSVYLRDVLESEEFQSFPSKLAFAVGEDIAGNAIVWDIAKMPHLLIAGATGSGKSVCINTLITSILYKASPAEVKLLLIDPKVVELSVYNGIPHLLIPVVTDPKKAASALNWAVKEMLTRYHQFADSNVRDIKGFNDLKREKGQADLMPQIVIIIDELADLMMAAANEVEDSVCRLAQMARAAGMHLIIATQRPSVDVITGVIKANIPSRLAFAVSSGTDSRTILDMVGAEKLLGKGDMLFYPFGASKPIRIQGAFVTDKEVEAIVASVKKYAPAKYDKEMINKITENPKMSEFDGETDEFFQDAVKLVIEKEKASASMLQRQFKIGYNRAARLIDELEKRGIVGPEDGSRPRKVLVNARQIQEHSETI